MACAIFAATSRTRSRPSPSQASPRRNPTTILNFPEQTHGYVLSQTAGTLIGINYSTEASAGTAATFTPNPASVGAAV